MKLHKHNNNIEIEEYNYQKKKNNKINLIDYEQFYNEFVKIPREGSRISDSSPSSYDYNIEKYEYAKIKSKIKHISSEILNLKNVIKDEKLKDLKYLNCMNCKCLSKNNKLISQVMEDQSALLYEIKVLRNKLNKLKECKKRMK